MISIKFVVDTAKQSVNFAKFVKRNLSKDRFKTVSDEVLKFRQSQCKTCQHFSTTGNFGIGKCTICGCTPLKLKFESERCPKGKW